MKFSHKIIATSSAILFAALSGMSFWQYTQVKAQEEATVKDSLEEIISGVKNSVDLEISSRMLLGEFTSQLIADNPDKEFIQNILNSPTIKNTFLLAAMTYKADGSRIDNDPSWTPGATWDPRVRPWYTAAVSANKTIMTLPYADSATNEMLSSVASPVTHNGELVGATFYDMSLKNLTTTINEVSLFDAGFIFMVSRDGTIIVHPDSDLLGKNMSSFLPNVSISEDLTPLQINGKPNLVKFTQIESQDWYLGILMDQEILYQALNKLKNSAIGFTAGAVIFAILALFVLLQSLMRPLVALNDAMREAASGQGDLTQRLSTNTDAEFAELASNFNDFTAKLQSLIRQVKGLANDILLSSDKTAEGSANAAIALNKQVEEVEQLATAMHEMATTSTDVAGNAQGASSATQQADHAVEEGVGIVTHTTEAISTLSDQLQRAVAVVHELENSTNNIESILVVINGIADQTNLLALNAAIEAARAGESGRGFAVVADEVRTLAQRTQESTTEISSMIEKLQSGANSVVTVMEESNNLATSTVDKAAETSVALDKISQSITQISDMNLQIASAAEEQSLVAEEINNNTVNIKDLSQEISDSAQQAALQMEEQVKFVKEQDNILNKFII